MDQIIHAVTTLVPMVGSGVVSYAKSLFDYETDEDSHRTIPEIIESRGFKCETHTAMTNDGYILTLHRIVNPLAKRMNVDMPPVLLAHGLFTQASYWLIASNDGHLEPLGDRGFSKNGVKSAKKKKPTNNLAFALANNAYDVWLMGWRGTKNSKHRRYSASDAKFWDFCLDDWVAYDLPSSIDLVLEKTQRSTLSFVGVGQAAAAALGLLCQEAEFNGKLKGAILLAPTVRLSNVGSMRVPLTNMRISLPRIIKQPVFSYIGSLLVNSSPGRVVALSGAQRAIKYLAAENPLHERISRLMLKMCNIFTSMDAERKRLSVLASHASLVTSRKNLGHISQMTAHKEFCKLDYGRKDNQEVYGDIDPPEYELKNITNRTICIFHCRNNSVTSERDVDFIINQLKVPLFDEYLIPDLSWGHADFMVSRKLGSVVHPRILEVLHRANKISDDDVDVAASR